MHSGLCSFHALAVYPRSGLTWTRCLSRPSGGGGTRALERPHVRWGYKPQSDSIGRMDRSGGTCYVRRTLWLWLSSHANRRPSSGRGQHTKEHHSRDEARPASNERDRDGEGERRKAFEEWLAKKEEDCYPWTRWASLPSTECCGRTTKRDEAISMPETHQGGFKVTTDGLIRQRRERSRCSRGPH